MIANCMLGVSHHALGDQVKGAAILRNGPLIKPESHAEFKPDVCAGYDQRIRALIAFSSFTLAARLCRPRGNP